MQIKLFCSSVFVCVYTNSLVRMGSVRQEYLNPRQAASFAGKAKFIQNQKFKDQKVGEELNTIKAYYLHVPASKIFPRRKVSALFPKFLYCSDLVDLVNLESQNRGYRYILVIVDAFTK